MHIHIRERSPCSILSLDELYESISPHLDGICITDHGVLKKITYLPSSSVKTFFGVELSSREGDILAYGLNMVPSKDLDAKKIIRYIHHQRGVAIAAHPFSNRHYAFHDSVFDYEFDALEINGSIPKSSNEKAKMAANEMDIPLIGGSDAHSEHQLNSIATKFDNPINSINDIVRAIKERECSPIRL